MFRRKWTILIGVSLWLGAPGALRAAARRPPAGGQNLTAIVDGKIITGLPLQTIEGKPYLSLREVRVIFGGRESGRRVSRRFSYTLGGSSADFRMDSSTAAVGGETVFLEGNARLSSGQAHVPLSFLTTREFQDMAASTVHYDDGARTLTVDSVPGVSSPRFYSYPEKSRVMLELSPRVHHRELSRKQREFSLRLFGGRPLQRERLEIRDGLIESVELSPGANSCDLTITLAASAGPPVVRLDESPRQLVVEVAAAGLENSPAPMDHAAAPRPRADMHVPLALESSLRGKVPSPLMALSPLKTIVIDPGHGGKDVGAVGAHGTLEKNANLAIARALARVLEREGRHKVILTRQDDAFLSLQERADIANKNKADLFVSIHCNSSLSRQSNGFEIYFMSEKATDAAAAAVARRENAVVELEGVTGQAKEKLSELLWALSKTETMNESSEIAALIDQQVGRRLSIPIRGVKQAGFFVLKGATMPAVLVESAFISYPKEEGWLCSARFQDKLADALYAGIVDYEKRKIQSKVDKNGSGGN